jgi:hypothetical protein
MGWEFGLSKACDYTGLHRHTYVDATSRALIHDSHVSAVEDRMCVWLGVDVSRWFIIPSVERAC